MSKSVGINPFCPVIPFGFIESTDKNIDKVIKIHTKTCSHEHNPEKLKKQAAAAIKTSNLINVLGYISFFFIGNIVGAMRIFYAISTPMKAETKLQLLARGVMEFSGLSLLCLVMDVAATILQRTSYKQNRV